MTRGFVALLSAVAIAGPAYIGTAMAENEEIVWQYALSAVVPNTAYMRYQEEIIPARIKEATNGRLTVIPHRGLVKSADVLDAVRDRRVDMGNQGAIHRGDMPLFDFAALPGIIPFDVLPKIHAKLEPIFGQRMEEKFGVTLLGYGYWPRQALLSKRPVLTVADWEGLKVRSHSVTLQRLLSSSVDAAPVSMAFADVYLSLQRGTIDAAISSMIAFKSVKWYEHAKYTASWPLGNANYFFVVNADAWNELPDDLKPIVKKVVSQAGYETWAKALEEEGQVKAWLSEKGVEHLQPSEDEKAKLAKIAEPLLGEWKKRAGPKSEDVIGIVNEALGTQY